MKNSPKKVDPRPAESDVPPSPGSSIAWKTPPETTHQSNKHAQLYKENSDAVQIRIDANEAEQQGRPPIAPRGRVAKTTLILKRQVDIIERRKTLLSLVIPNRKLLRILIAVYKNTVVVYAIMVMWLVCMVNGLAVYFQAPFFPQRVYVCLQIITTFNFSIHHSVFIRTGILKALARSFNFWYTLINIISFHICIIFLWGSTSDIICASIHSLSSSLFILLFYDAHALKHIPMMRVCVLLGIVCLSPMFVMLQFNLIHFNQVSLEGDGSRIQFVNVRLQAIDNLSAMVIYLVRTMYTHLVLKKPNTIAFISYYYTMKPRYEPSLKLIEIQESRQSAAPTEPSQGGPSTPTVPVMPESHPPMADSAASVTISTQVRIIPPRVESQPVQNASSSAQSLENSIVMSQESLQNNGIRLEKPEEKLYVGITSEKSVDYDTHDTLFHKVLVPGYPVIAGIFKSKAYKIIGVLCGFAPFVLVPLALGYDPGVWLRIIGDLITLCGTAFIVSQMVFTSNIFIVRNMFRSFDYWYVMFLIGKIFMSYGVLCGWDYRMVYWTFTALTLKWCVMIDTFHISYRKLSYVSIIGMMWMTVIGVLCKLRMGRTFEEDRNIGVGGKQLMSAQILLFSSCFSVVVFVTRFFITYIQNPNRMLFISENVRVEEVRR